MNRANVRTLVDRERDKLLEGKDGITDAVITRPNRGQTVAVGLLALDEVDEANAWFRALTDEWLIYADNKWEAKYEEEPRSPASPGPWSDYIDGLFAALLGRHDVDSVAETVHGRSTASFVDELDKREFAHQIDLAQSLSGTILGVRSVEQSLKTLEQHVAENGNEWDTDRYSAYRRFIRGLRADSEPEVSAGIEGLLDFHRDHVASARDADAVQQAVALDGTAMLALARREGMAITVDHDAVPDALNDDEHYPVEG